jgi:hypothetical protein
MKSHLLLFKQNIFLCHDFGNYIILESKSGLFIKGLKSSRYEKMVKKLSIGLL